MPKEPTPTPSRRVAASDDLEVSAYLEIARQKSGQEPPASTRAKSHNQNPSSS